MWKTEMLTIGEKLAIMNRLLKCWKHGSNEGFDRPMRAVPMPS